MDNIDFSEVTLQIFIEAWSKKVKAIYNDLELTPDQRNAQLQEFSKKIALILQRKSPYEAIVGQDSDKEIETIIKTGQSWATRNSLNLEAIYDDNKLQELIAQPKEDVKEEGEGREDEENNNNNNYDNYNNDDNSNNNTSRTVATASTTTSDDDENNNIFNTSEVQVSLPIINQVIENFPNNDLYIFPVSKELTEDNATLKREIVRQCNDLDSSNQYDASNHIYQNNEVLVAIKKDTIDNTTRTVIRA